MLIGTGLLRTPLTVTTTFPVVAPNGTTATIAVGLQLLLDAATPLNVTVLVPEDEPKFVPVMVTGAPIVADAVDKLVMLGIGSTVKGAPALAVPFTVTTTLPVLAPVGTGATILVKLQLVGVAAVPLKVNVLVPCVEPKFTPLTVIGIATVPDVGDKLLMVGVGDTVKAAALLEAPFTVTTTLPLVALNGTGTLIEVALQLVGVAAVPLKVTVLSP